MESRKLYTAYTAVNNMFLAQDQRMGMWTKHFKEAKLWSNIEDAERFRSMCLIVVAIAEINVQFNIESFEKMRKADDIRALMQKAKAEELDAIARQRKLRQELDALTDVKPVDPVVLRIFDPNIVYADPREQ